MTERLYYQDPDLQRFRARLLSQEPGDGGWHVLLDRTAFYPEGGGQPADRGVLGGVPVCDVRLDGERILHVLPRRLELDNGAAASPGAEVDGAVDPQRRLEFRQQHTGQHLLSACLERGAGARTVSSSLGERFTTIEVDTPSLAEDALEAVQREANRLVGRNLPVRVQWVPRGEVGRFALRKPPPPEVDPLRIVQIEGLDASACGGLHLAGTGEVGLIKLAGQERIRGRLRLSWLIGERAYRDTGQKDALAAEMGRELSCGPEEIAAAVRELKGRLKAGEALLASLERRLSAALAPSLLAGAEALPGGGRLVVREFPGESPSLLQRLAQELLAVPGTVLCLATTTAQGQTGAQAPQVHWWVGHSPDLALPLEELVRPALAAIDGRGGGRAGRWQGGGRRPEGLAEFLRAVADGLRRRAAEGGNQ